MKLFVLLLLNAMAFAEMCEIYTPANEYTNWRLERDDGTNLKTYEDNDRYIFQRIKSDNQYVISRDGAELAVNFRHKVGGTNDVVAYKYNDTENLNCAYTSTIVQQIRDIRDLKIDATKSFDTSYGKTIIELEAAEKKSKGHTSSKEDIENATAAYKDLVAKIRSKIKIPFSLEQAINVIRTEALLAGIQDYYRDNTTILDTLNGHGGNCVASTALLSALIKDLDLPLPKDWKLGAEVFKDHIQAVLHNSKTGEVIDILAAEKKKEKEPIVTFDYLMSTAFDDLDDWFPGKIKLESPVDDYEKYLHSDAFAFVEDYFSGKANSGVLVPHPVRVDIFTLDEISTDSIYNEGGAPERTNMSFLLDREVNINEEAKEEDDKPLNGFNFASFLGGDGEGQNRTFSFTKEHVENSDFNDETKKAYIEMLERGYPSNDDITKFSLKNVRDLIPNYEENSDLSTHFSIVDPRMHNFTNPDSSVADLERERINGIITQSIKHVNELKEKLYGIENKFPNPSDVLFEIGKNIQMLRMVSQIPFDHNLQEILLHNKKGNIQPSVNLILKGIDDYISNMMKELASNPHNFIQKLNAMSNEEIFFFFQNLNQLDSGSLYTIFGRRGENAKNPKIDEIENNVVMFKNMMKDFLLRNKDFQYTYNKEVEIAESQEEVKEQKPCNKLINPTPDINLPKVAPADVCQGKSGYVQWGFFMVNCNDEIERQQKLEKQLDSREIANLNSNLILNILSSAELNPVDYIFINKMWNDDLEAEYTNQHLVDGNQPFRSMLDSKFKDMLTITITKGITIKASDKFPKLNMEFDRLEKDVKKIAEAKTSSELDEITRELATAQSGEASDEPSTDSSEDAEPEGKGLDYVATSLFDKKIRHPDLTYLSEMEFNQCRNSCEGKLQANLNDDLDSVILNNPYLEKPFQELKDSDYFDYENEWINGGNLGSIARRLTINSSFYYRGKLYHAMDDEVHFTDKSFNEAAKIKTEFSKFYQNLL